MLGLAAPQPVGITMCECFKELGGIPRPVVPKQQVTFVFHNYISTAATMTRDLQFYGSHRNIQNAGSTNYLTRDSTRQAWMGATQL